MSAMIERATEAVILAWYPQAAEHRIVSPKIYAEARTAVIAALAAIREPDHETLVRGSDEIGKPKKSLPQAWRDMINSILGTP